MPKINRFSSSFKRCVGVVLVAAMALVFASVQPCRADQETHPVAVLRNRIFSFKQISAEQAEKYLAELGIGETITPISAANAIMVTAQPHDLIKATTVLKLVDRPEKCLTKTLCPGSLPEHWPLNEQIAAQLADMKIATFLEPLVTAESWAIVDIYRGDLIAIAPAGQIDKIVAAVDRLQARARLGAEPEEAIASQAKTRGADLFNELFDTLLEAEKVARKEKQSAEAVIQPAEKTLPQPVTAPSETHITEPPRPLPEPETPKVQPKAPRAAEPEKPLAPAEPAPTPAVEPMQELQILNGDDILELDLPEKVEIVALLDLVGRHLNLDYMYDEAALKGKFVNLKLQGPMKVKDLYALLESVMKFRKFAMTRKHNLVTIVPIGEASGADPVLTETIQPGDVVITRVFKLEHINTATAKTLLSGMKLGVSITDVAETGTLIITGYAFRMQRIENLLRLVDQPGKPKKFKFRQLEHTTAKAIVPKVKTLAEQLGTISVTVSAVARRAPAKPTPRPGRRTPARKPPTPAKPQPTTATSITKPTVYLDFDERTNRILMIGPTEQIEIVEELIDVLDIEQPDLRSIKEYEIQHVDAVDVVDTLNTLGIITTGPGATRRQRPTTTTRPAPTKTTRPTTTAPAATGEEEPQIAIIATTNSLLVNATAEQHAAIAMVIAYVDREPEEVSIPYVVYSLENQDPEDLAGVLEKLIQRTTKAVAKGAKVQPKVREEEEEITVVPDPKTYSLIVYASKKNQQWIGSLIKALDEYRPQVLLDVTLVEITKNDEFTLDLNVISSFPDLISTSGSITGIGTIIEGTTSSAAKTSADIISKLNSSGRDRFIDLQSFGGSGTAFYGDRHINLLLDAVQTKDYGRVLARPKLLVNDNEEGNIKTEETTYVPREKVTFRKGAVGEEDIPITETTFDPYMAGIQLNIKPHISKGDQLQLQITLTRTDFRITEEVITLGKPPDTVTSDVTTVITVPDSTTIILGGLERLNQGKGGTKVPLLGDIPLIGGLFRSTANTDAQSRLYVFVKAHILRPGEELTGDSDIERVSRKNRATFERYEEEMQKYEDWPGIKPKPMDPVRILESD